MLFSSTLYRVGLAPVSWRSMDFLLLVTIRKKVWTPTVPSDLRFLFLIKKHTLIIKLLDHIEAMSVNLSVGYIGYKFTPFVGF